MSSQNIPKDVNTISKAILSGYCYQCFDSDSLRLFLDSIKCTHQNKNWLQLQARCLIILSWYLPRIPIKVLLQCVNTNFKIDRKQIKVALPGYDKVVISLIRFDKKDPFARELWDYIHLLNCFAHNEHLLCFSQLITRYVDSLGYQDSTRKLRYHLRRWLRNYNNKVGSVK
jgi:hypothetical protein